MLWVEHGSAQSHQPSGEHQPLDSAACQDKTTQQRTKPVLNNNTKQMLEVKELMIKIESIIME